MSPQMIELLVFAAIAFFLINKLLSILGNTSESDQQEKSFFGEPFSMKDVTQKLVLLDKIDPGYTNKDIIDPKNKKHVLERLPIINSKLNNFDLAKFVKGSISAFSMLTKADAKNDKELLDNLVDKRFIEEFSNNAEKYSKYQLTNPDAKVTDLYLFGNNVFIKILFKDGSGTLQEIWTFTKNSNNAKLSWFLSNIEVADDV